MAIRQQRPKCGRPAPGAPPTEKLANAAGPLRPILSRPPVSAIVPGPLRELSKLCDDALLSHRVRLPLRSVEPGCERNPYVLAAAKFNHYPDRGRPAPQHRNTLRPERSSLPVRLPGEHLHPQLRRSSWDCPSGRAGNSA